MKKKLISIIIMLLILTVLLATLIPNNVNAVETAQELLQMGPASVGQNITITYKTEMNVPSNEMIYCLEQNQANGSTVTYTVGVYVEIADGIAKVWDVNGLAGETSDYAEENKILAEILTGNHGKKGYTIDGASHNYTPTQRALYCYMDTWFAEVGRTVGTDGWNVGNGYVDNGEGTEVVSKAKAAVEAGANPSAKFCLVIYLEGVSWQKLLIADAGGSSNSKVTINKKDHNSLAALANVKFVIKNAEGQYLQAEVVNAANNEFKVSSFGGNPTEFYTNSRGQFTITGLPPGKYTIIEKGNPNKTDFGLDYTDSDQEVTFLVENSANQEVDLYNMPERPPNETVVNDREGNVSLSGRVWEDLLRGKANITEGNIDSDESGVSGVKVYWKSSDGKVLASTTTDSNGNYSMKQTIYIHDHTYWIDQDKYNSLNNSYVEFEYNGLKYTTVKLGTSKGKENEASRIALDNSFKEVTANEVKDGGYRLSYSSGNHSSTLNQSNTDFLVSADTKGQVNDLMVNAKTEEHQYCIRGCSCGEHKRS